MKISARRAVVCATALLLALGTLTACSTGSKTQGGTSSASTASIGLLLPNTVSARYETADKPYFEAKVASLCPGCTVLYANADGDAAKQQQQAESMLTEGA
jgi:D-xylose transport system substrate-binding protein